MFYDKLVGNKFVAFALTFSTFKLYEYLDSKVDFSPTILKFIHQLYVGKSTALQVYSKGPSSYFRYSIEANLKLNSITEASHALFMLKHREVIYKLFSSFKDIAKDISKEIKAYNEFYDQKNYLEARKELIKFSGQPYYIIPKSSLTLKKDNIVNSLNFNNKHFTDHAVQVILEFKKLQLNNLYIDLYKMTKEYEDPNTALRMKNTLKKQLTEKGVTFENSKINYESIKLKNLINKEEMKRFIADIDGKEKELEREFTNNKYIVQKIINDVVINGDMVNSYKKYSQKAHPDMKQKNYLKYIDFFKKTGCEESQSKEKNKKCAEHNIKSQLEAFKLNFGFESNNELYDEIREFCSNPEHQDELFCKSNLEIEFNDFL